MSLLANTNAYPKILNDTKGTCLGNLRHRTAGEARFPPRRSIFMDVDDVRCGDVYEKPSQHQSQLRYCGAHTSSKGIRG
ncbi:uncharacterized protein Dana_GF27372 [Drosophila ananassae]|uniref:Uncharacterized protein n=1 Tax=Drosophila ananassae TaxID=7217 RepID=A0A0P8XSY9_DROAN|nr:uncharacterized protein LOC123257093 isoform X2 [Drosophila ananassae]KPU77843.1 uncharacterized protein Dana_GF27372 [Drosophila ananassae]